MANGRYGTPWASSSSFCGLPRAFGQSAWPGSEAMTTCPFWYVFVAGISQAETAKAYRHRQQYLALYTACLVIVVFTYHSGSLLEVNEGNVNLLTEEDIKILAAGSRVEYLSFFIYTGCICASAYPPPTAGSLG